MRSYQLQKQNRRNKQLPVFRTREYLRKILTVKNLWCSLDIFPGNWASSWKGKQYRSEWKKCILPSYINTGNRANENTLQLKPIESPYNYVMSYQPTFAQAQNLRCRSLETIVRFTTNFSSFIPDLSCSVPGALVSNIPGIIQIIDVVEVGFKW